MGITNLFFHRGPIRDRTHFFDREREVNQALSLLVNGQSIALIGPRRIGKTSFLFHIADPTVYQGILSHAHLFVFVDCGSLAQLDQPGIFRALLEEISALLAQRGSDAPFVDTLDDSSPITFRGFERACAKLVDQGWKPILVLDEFELMSQNPALDPEFFSGLRALASRYALVFLTASRQPLLELTYANSSALSSPFFNIFASIRLGLFSIDTARGLLHTLTYQGGYAYGEGIITRLLTLAGAHPLFLQIAGYHAFELKIIASNHDWTELERRFAADAREHFLYAWRILNIQEQRILATLPASQDGDLDLLRALEQKCLIVREAAGCDYFSSAFRDFAQSQAVPGLLQAGPIAIDRRSHQVLLRGQTLNLTQSQYDLLAYLIEQKGRVATNEELEEALWGERFVEDPGRLKSVIKGLRRALGNDGARLENVRAIGYLWRGGKSEAS
jgi:hypothetical protein